MQNSPSTQGNNHRSIGHGRYHIFFSFEDGPHQQVIPVIMAGMRYGDLKIFSVIVSHCMGIIDFADKN